MTSVPDRLTKAADIYRERNKLYGDNYKQFGKVLRMLFPSGIALRTVDEFNRFSLYLHILNKVSRYGRSLYERKGHADSLDDLAVYSQMLREIDDEIANPPLSPIPIPVPAKNYQTKYQEGQEVWHKGQKTKIKRAPTTNLNFRWYELENGASIREESLDAEQIVKSDSPTRSGVGPGAKAKPRVPRRRNGRRVRRGVQRRKKAGT